MTSESLQEVFGEIPGVRKDGHVFLIPEESNLSIYVGLAAEVITIDRLSRVSVSREIVAAETHRGQRFHFAAEDVAIVRVNSPNEPGGAPGFHG